MASLSRAATELSSDCRVKSAYGPRAALRRLRRALKERRTVKLLAIGSSSTVGIGASSPAAAYPVRLESNLEGFLPGFDIQMTNRGVSGETGQGAVERIKLEVAEIDPDLVVWQVGTNDAMARIDEDEFAEMLRSTLSWLAANRIDVVLIDPQYVERLASDEHYTGIVEAISAVARDMRVLLVHRFEAMADLAKQRGNAAFLAQDRFHPNDLGYRCMAEYAARAIAAGILQAEAEAVPQN
ncbi:MAG: SGNH/GDSL hydrolase family protein [Hyphomicrobiaceae bacterium]|nr:SGNH/GDSL hydrolase family protein [Hyphomicrobiaceae bacterium]